MASSVRQVILAKKASTACSTLSLAIFGAETEIRRCLFSDPVPHSFVGIEVRAVSGQGNKA